MTHRMPVVWLGLMVAVTVSLSGCAGRVHLSSKTMCEAHGGTYSSDSKQCAYPAQPSTRSAADICRMHGGELDPVDDTCAVNDRTK